MIAGMKNNMTIRVGTTLGEYQPAQAIYTIR